MATEWVDLVHEQTGHVGRVPNKPSVIAARRAKGWRPVGETVPAAADAGKDSEKTRKARSRAADNEE